MGCFITNLIFSVDRITNDKSERHYQVHWKTTIRFVKKRNLKWYVHVIRSNKHSTANLQGSILGKC